MKIKISALDALFSKYIRLRDGRCMCCADSLSPHKGDPHGHCGRIRATKLHAAHIFSRGQKSVRFNTDNAIAADFICHAWMDQHTTEKHTWHAARLGPERWADLQRRAATPGKPDQALILLWLRQALQKLEAA